MKRTGVAMAEWGSGIREDFRLTVELGCIDGDECVDGWGLLVVGWLTV